MEKDRYGKIIAIVALVVAVVALSIGFAAFTSNFTIDTAANVTTGSGNWNVGFSTDGTNVIALGNTATKNANENGNPGVLDVTKYTIAQNTNATLTTTSGSSVSYSLYIKNAGSVPAYLSSVTFPANPLSCANAAAGTSTIIEGTATAGSATTGGNTSTITEAACNAMFDVTLSIDSTNYTTTTAGTSSNVIAAGASVPVTLTISYNATNGATYAAALDGDIVVTAGTIAVVYQSNVPS